MFERSVRARLSLISLMVLSERIPTLSLEYCSLLYLDSHSNRTLKHQRSNKGTGVYNGDAYNDTCGVCDADPTNDCERDCHGIFGGDAYLDGCYVCDDNVYVVFERYVRARSARSLKSY